MDFSLTSEQESYRDCIVTFARQKLGERCAEDDRDAEFPRLKWTACAEMGLTGLLLERLAESAPSRVLTMSSGGMYTANLTVSGLQMSADDYKGAEQYARAKRAQVALNELWAARLGDAGIHFHALHPGWADTPGVDASLPTFSKVVGPLLRTADQGADTLVWLAADNAALESDGLFWLDRLVQVKRSLQLSSFTMVQPSVARMVSMSLSQNEKMFSLKA